jgi:hypothetical protein
MLFGKRLYSFDRPYPIIGDGFPTTIECDEDSDEITSPWVLDQSQGKKVPTQGPRPLPRSSSDSICSAVAGGFGEAFYFFFGETSEQT